MDALDSMLPLMAAALIVPLGVLAYIHGSRQARVSARRFTCPREGHSVDCVVARTADGKTEVLSCTKFSHPDRVSCDQECGRQIERGIELV